MAQNHDAADLILTNAIDFLNEGLDIIFTVGGTTRQSKSGIVLVQTAIELLAKYRLVKEHGLIAIIRGAVPSGDLRVAALNGSLRTIGYGECLKAIRKDEAFSEIEEELVSRVQQLRNSLVHFSAEIDINQVRMDLAWLLIRALGMFAAGQERDQGEMQTHARFLDPANFHRLINFQPYRDEAVDSALDNIDSEDVHRCWECGVDSLSVRPSDNYFCHCCGLTAYLGSASFTGCTVCGEARGVCYDPLNETQGAYRGRCLFCRTFIEVVICDSCSAARSQVAGFPVSCTECVED